MYMDNNKSSHEKFNRLRRQAQDLLKGKAFAEAAADFKNPLQLLHELSTYQIELELQAEELHRSQQELMAFKIRFTELYDFAPTGYISMNPKGQILAANLTFTDMLSLERSFITGRSLSDYIAAGEQDIFHLHLQQLAGSHTKQTCELRMKTKQGTLVDVQLISIVIKDRDETLQYRTVISDITGQKAAEKALQESETRYRSMMESITDPLYICSPELIVEYMNPAMTNRLGRDATGEKCHKVMHGLDHKCDWCAFDRVAQGESLETSMISPLDQRTYRVTNMPIQNKSGTISKMSIFRDITDYLAAVEEKDKAQARFLQSQKMESIGILAGGIAHDFNNILSPIIGFAEMLAEDFPENSNMNEGLSEILSAAMRAKELVKQILIFSRQAEDHEVQPIQPHLIVREVGNLIKSIIPASIEIKTLIDKKTRTILADPTQIHQVAMNLVTNAYHAMQESGGVLTIRLGNIDGADIREQTSRPRAGPHVLLSVEDTGIGMDKTTLEKIFDPFFTTKPMGKGTGLGLSVAYGIVTAYGGDISVTSTPGKGSVFNVYFPAALQDMKLERPMASDLMPTGNERILLVDDEPAVLLTEKLVLEKLGYTVEPKYSGSDALNAIKAAPDFFDLVITDMSMPKMSGIQLFQKIMEIRPSLPVIICTGYSEGLSVETTAAIGIKALLMKPVISSEIAATVRKILDETKND